MIVSHNGVRSDRFGHKNEVKYECNCGAVSGLRYTGLECPYCGGIVTKRGVNMKMTGWVDLQHHKIISPLYYIILCGLIGKTRLVEILTKKWIFSKNGINKDYEVDLKTLKTKGSKYTFVNEVDNSISEVYTPFAGIGFQQFYDRFDEVLDYCAKKHKKMQNKLDLIDELRQTKAYVFTSKIPIYTTVLRPQFTTEKNFNFRPIDNYINNLVKLALNLPNQYNRADILEKSLMSIQEKVMQMWDYTFECISKKKGEIRGKILGGPLNYTARNVCVLRKGLYANEIEIGYPLACIIYKYKIIYQYAKRYNLAIHEAEDIVNNTEEFNPNIYEILLDFIKNEGLEAIIIRNPTNNLGSILKMKISHIVPNTKYHCIGLPSMILGGLTCDFDGDVINIIGLMTPEMKHIFRLADPIDTMITDKDTSNIRPSMNIDDSASMVIYNFSRL